MKKTSELKTTENIDLTMDENKKDTSNKVDFDDLLSTAGEFGLYQNLLFFSTFPFYVFGAFTYFSQLFMTEVSQNHWCWIPELANLSDIERRQLAIPLDDTSPVGYSRCSAFVANWTEVLSTGLKIDHNWPTAPCQNGWEFNNTEIPYSTISSEMAWVCDKDSYQATSQSIFFVGSIVGGVLIGWIGDRFGRLPGAVVSNLIGCVGGVISTFSRNFGEFAASRFFMGISYDNCMIMIYLLVLEYVAPKYRTIIANLPFALFFTFGVVALPWIAIVCGHWKILSLATSIPLISSVLALFIIPESPRWLLSKGRVEDALVKLKTIARVNKKEIPSKLIDQFKITNNKREEETNKGMLEVLKRPLIRRAFICICLQFMCCMIVFDGLVRTLHQLKFDFFVSFTLVSLTEFPSLMLVSFILDWTGRKWLSILVFIISCIFSILAVFVGGGLSSVICAVIARFTINIAYNASMQWAAELFPTSVRGTCVSIVHICSYIAVVISPFISYLEKFAYWLPLVVIGCVAAIGAFLSLFLPETAKKEMPQTFKDSEDLMKIQKVFDIPFLNKKLDAIGQENPSFEL